MTSKLLSFFVLLVASLPMRAGEPWLRHPLHFLPADSVRVWSVTDGDFRSLALMADPSATPYPWGLTKADWKHKKQILKDWMDNPVRLNRVGGEEDEDLHAQALSAVRRMDKAAVLFLTLGNAGCIDVIERGLYNALVPTLTDSTAAPVSLERTVAASALLSASRLVYAADRSDNLYVNLYTNSTARVEWGDQVFTLDQITAMPDDGRVKLRFTQLSRPTRIRLHIRIPDWTLLRSNEFAPFQYFAPERQEPALFVNGHEVELSAMDEKGYVVIDREWKSMDEVYVDLALPPLYFRPQCDEAANGGLLRGNRVIQRGPLVYRIKQPTSGCYFSLTQPVVLTGELDRRGRLLLKGTMYRDATAPQDAAAEPVPFEAESH